MSSENICPYCRRIFNNAHRLRQHFSLRRKCGIQENAHLERSQAIFRERGVFAASHISHMDSAIPVTHEVSEAMDSDTGINDTTLLNTESQEVLANDADSLISDSHIPNSIIPDSATTHLNIPNVSPSLSSEDNEFDAGGMPQQPWIESYPVQNGIHAGHVYSQRATYFEELKTQRESQGFSKWAPFKDEEEWELAQWLIRSGLSQTAIDEFLKLAVVSYMCTIIENKRSCTHLILDTATT